MFLQWLLAWIRTKRRGSTQSQDDLGVVISTRLKQLLPVKDPKPVGTAPTQTLVRIARTRRIAIASEHNHSSEQGLNK
jgi:hypothetical protein